VIRRVGELSRGGGPLAEKARDSLSELRWACEASLKGKRGRRHLRRYLAPVRDILGLTEADLAPEEPSPRRPSPKPAPAERPAPPPLEAALEWLSDPDTPTAALSGLRSIDWAGYDAEARAALRPLLLESRDALVRGIAPYGFAAWGDQEALLALLYDPELAVRKGAAYHLGQTPPFREEISERLWERLQAAGRLGVHAGETLRAFAAHAGAEAARPALLSVAADEAHPEHLRHAAIDELKRLAARAEIAALAPLLSAPPQVTWGLHMALLSAFESLRLAPPPLGGLLEVDSLWLRGAIAPLLDDKAAR
jgi:hypothetical protein